jgi:hypothetical protein
MRYFSPTQQLVFRVVSQVFRGQQDLPADTDPDRIRIGEALRKDCFARAEGIRQK